MVSKKKSAFGAHKLFREVRWEVLKVHFLLQFLNAALLFFFINIVLTFFNMRYWWSLGIALIWFLWRLTHGWKASTLRRLEEGNPEVDELLRTAYQYRDHESLMVQGLVYDLQRKMSTVSAGVLINPKELGGKLLAVALLAFIPLAIISFAPFLIQQNPLQDLNVRGTLSSITPERFRDTFGLELNESQDFFGDHNVKELGTEKLDIDVTTGAGGVSFETISDAEDKQFRYNDYPGGVDAIESESSTGTQYSEDDLNLINEYNCASKGTCK